MPPICQQCNEIGHTSKRCKNAPITCSICSSSSHENSNCTRLKKAEQNRKPSRRHKSNPPAQEWQVRNNPRPAHTPNGASRVLVGEGSGLTPADKYQDVREVTKLRDRTDDEKSSELEHDSSDTYSADSEGYHDDHQNFIKVQTRRKLITLSADQRISGKPWIVLGDFNQTLHPEEHSKPPSLNADAPTRLFRDALLEADLADLTYKGPLFTWTNKSKTNLIAKKLDRALVNDEWLTLIPDSIAVFGEPDFSDHAVCGVILKPTSTRGKRPFRFYNFLLHNEQFLDHLTELWYSLNVNGSAMLTIAKKLKLIKSDIRTFSRDNYSNLERRVQEAHNRLLTAQQSLLQWPSEATALTERTAMEEWQILSKAEESFLIQRSHINSIKGGDCNSAYFHRLIATRRATNHIHYLLDENDNRVRLASWGLNIPTTCCLCAAHEESRDHLFLGCSYTIDLWKLIFAFAGPQSCSSPLLGRTSLTDSGFHSQHPQH
ncbi:hypothetical protein Bca52824_002253 [Brassica carinata]|uniref:CCHC-type domain-containing protein n=1 Tax=Brassica carinata TaxID=52824 RepID=A0A8X8BE51_BRACI|nr:hypothetical protein Bca52824_002253 [Brassica carinata]